MPVPLQKDCLDLLQTIHRELAELKEFVYQRQQWPVAQMEDLIEMLSILQGTNPGASLKRGYVREIPLGESTSLKEGQRFVCYEDAIQSLNRAPNGTEIIGPLDELQTNLEVELYSLGSGWPALEEKRVEHVTAGVADHVLGDIQIHWDNALNGLIKWYDINPILGYRRPYRQAVR